MTNINLGNTGGKFSESGSNETITATSTPTSSTLSNANFTITLSGSNDLVTLGNGTNSITVTGKNDAITLGTGADHVTFSESNDTTSSVTFATGTQTDSISITGSNDTTTISGGGTDTVSVTGTGDKEIFAGTETIKLTGSSADNVTITGKGDKITLADNYNDIVLFSESNDTTSTLSLGTGADTVTVSGNNDSLSISGSSNGMLTVSGTGDSITLNGGSNNAVSVTGANDTVTLNGGWDIVTLSNTGDTVNVASLLQAITLNMNAANETVNITVGGDVVTVNANYTSDIVNIESNLDIVTVNTSNNANINVLSNVNKLTVNGSGNTIHAGNNSNLINVEGNNDIVNAAASLLNVVNFVGTGDQLVTSGGSDIVSFNAGTTNGAGGTVIMSGGGSVRIADNNKDTITMSGNGGTLGYIKGDGNGNDTVMGTGNNETVTLGNGNDLVNLSGNTESIAVGGGNDVILVTGSAGHNSVSAVGNGSDYVDIAGPSSIVLSGSGNDTLVYHPGDTALSGGSGFNTLLLNTSVGTIDLTASSSPVHHIQFIDLTNDLTNLAGYGTTLDLNVATVNALAGSVVNPINGKADTLVVLAGANDVVNIGAVGIGGWTNITPTNEPTLTANELLINGSNTEVSAPISLSNYQVYSQIYNNVTNYLIVDTTDRTPVAVNQPYTVNESTALTYPLGSANITPSSSVLTGDTPGLIGPTYVNSVTGLTTQSISNGGMATVFSSNNDGDSLTMKSDGTFTLNLSGLVANATDTFSYTISDNVLHSAPANITFSIKDPPLVTVTEPAFSLITTSSTGPLSVSGNLTTGDSGGDGAALQAALVSAPSHGTVNIGANGAFTYTDTGATAASYYGPESFTYTVTDGVITSGPLTATINATDTYTPVITTIGGMSTASLPVMLFAVNNTAESYAVTLGATTTPEAYTYSLAAVSGETNSNILVTEANPQVSLNGSQIVLSNNISYDQTDNGNIYLNYTVTDSNSGISTTDEVIITTDRTPVAINQSYTVNESTALTYVLGSANITPSSGVLTGDIPGFIGSTYVNSVTGLTTQSISNGGMATVFSSNNDGDSLTMKSDGTFTLNLNNLVANATDTFSYTISDNVLHSAPANITFSIQDPPLVTVTEPAFSLITTSSTGPTSVAGSLTTGDSGGDGATLQAISASNPSHGTVSIGANGAFIYTDTGATAASYYSPDTFTYTVTDGVITSGPLTATINVTDTYTPVITTIGGMSTTSLPVMLFAVQNTAESYAVTLGTTTTPEAYTYSLAAVTGNTNSNILVTETNPQVSLNGSQIVLSNNIAYNQTDNGNIYLNYTVTDSNSGISTTDEVIITTDRTPVAVNQPYTVNESTALTYALGSANITPSSGVLTGDIPGFIGSTYVNSVTGLTTQSISNGGMATVFSSNNDGDSLTMKSDGTFTLNLSSLVANATDTFSYTISDNVLQSAPANITFSIKDPALITVTEPAFSLITTGSTGPLSGSGNLTTGDSGGDGATLQAISASNPSHGTVSIGANGAFIYTDTGATAASYYSPDTFTYTVTDGVITSGPLTATINVTDTYTPVIATIGGMNTTSLPVMLSAVQNTAESYAVTLGTTATPETYIYSLTAVAGKINSNTLVTEIHPQVSLNGSQIVLSNNITYAETDNGNIYLNYTVKDSNSGISTTDEVIINVPQPLFTSGNDTVTFYANGTASNGGPIQLLSNFGPTTTMNTLGGNDNVTFDNSNYTLTDPSGNDTFTFASGATGNTININAIGGTTNVTDQNGGNTINLGSLTNSVITELTLTNNGTQMDTINAYLNTIGTNTVTIDFGSQNAGDTINLHNQNSSATLTLKNAADIVNVDDSFIYTSLTDSGGNTINLGSLTNSVITELTLTNNGTQMDTINAYLNTIGTNTVTIDSGSQNAGDTINLHNQNSSATLTLKNAADIVNVDDSFIYTSLTDSGGNTINLGSLTNSVITELTLTNNGTQMDTINAYLNTIGTNTVTIDSGSQNAGDTINLHNQNSSATLTLKNAADIVNVDDSFIYTSLTDSGGNTINLGSLTNSVITELTLTNNGTQMDTINAYLNTIGTNTVTIDSGSQNAGDTINLHNQNSSATLTLKNAADIVNVDDSFIYTSLTDSGGNTINLGSLTNSVITELTLTNNGTQMDTINAYLNTIGTNTVTIDSGSQNAGDTINLHNQNSSATLTLKNAADIVNVDDSFIYTSLTDSGGNTINLGSATNAVNGDSLILTDNSTHMDTINVYGSTFGINNNVTIEAGSQNTGDIINLHDQNSSSTINLNNILDVINFDDSNVTASITDGGGNTINMGSSTNSVNGDSLTLTDNSTHMDTINVYGNTFGINNNVIIDSGSQNAGDIINLYNQNSSSTITLFNSLDVVNLDNSSINASITDGGGNTINLGSATNLVNGETLTLTNNSSTQMDTINMHGGTTGTNTLNFQSGHTSVTNLVFDVSANIGSTTVSNFNPNSDALTFNNVGSTSESAVQNLVTITSDGHSGTLVTFNQPSAHGGSIDFTTISFQTGEQLTALAHTITVHS